MVRVKELAQLGGTTVRTIRYYHQLGLLAVPEEGTTWRSYGFVHLTRLMRIRWLVEAGVPLAEVPHLLQPPHGADERLLVVDDLDAVLASIDAKIAALTVQRGHVLTLLLRVRAHGRLSPLPPSLEQLYASLLKRPHTPAVAEAMARERDLIELACYAGDLPPDIVTLVDALGDGEVDEVGDIWEECHRLEQAAEGRLTDPVRRRIADLAARTIALATHTEPGATARLSARAVELDRPAVRAVVEVAYPSVVYRQLVTEVVAIAKRGVTP
jgi:DNA-binding transcriptional MerR regulator